MGAQRRVSDAGKLQVNCNNCSLDSICIPRGLAQQEVAHLSKVVRRQKTLQRGDFIYRRGDPFTGVLAIKTGTAKIIVSDSQGNEHVLGVLLPGELLGFDALSTDRHNCSAVALETLSFCQLPAEKLENLCQSVPSLMRELFRHAGEKLNDETRQLILNKRPAEERLASFLISLSDRSKSRGFSPLEFTLSLTRQEIGNHLGLALETVSRLLKKFQNFGLIQVNHKKIRITDAERLRRIYNGPA
ncbi:MAG: helix-turn-helix domain-containing protein [Pseudomonadota bacterium]